MTKYFRQDKKHIPSHQPMVLSAPADQPGQRHGRWLSLADPQLSPENQDAFPRLVLAIILKHYQDIEGQGAINIRSTYMQCCDDFKAATLHLASAPDSPVYAQREDNAKRALSTFIEQTECFEQPQRVATDLADALGLQINKHRII